MVCRGASVDVVHADSAAKATIVAIFTIGFAVFIWYRRGVDARRWAIAGVRAGQGIQARNRVMNCKGLLSGLQAPFMSVMRLARGELCDRSPAISVHASRSVRCPKRRIQMITVT